MTDAAFLRKLNGLPPIKKNKESNNEGDDIPRPT